MRTNPVLVFLPDQLAPAPIEGPSDGYCRAAWNAVCRSQAVVEFDMSGVVTWANERFLAVMGYDLDQLVGCHHRLLCDPAHVKSAEYQRFWGLLQTGAFHQGEVERRRADGSVVWLQATYNPIFDATGTTQRVLKVATDVTRQVLLEQVLQQNGVALQATMTELGGIVGSIARIARQTNLLALNATIEPHGPARLAAASPWSPPRLRSWQGRRALPPSVLAT